MELTAKIKFIGETKTFGSNGFKKREFVVTTKEDYPQTILIEVVQDKCALLDNFYEGQDVVIGINLRGREWTDNEGKVRYFNSIQAFKITSNEI